MLLKYFPWLRTFGMLIRLPIWVFILFIIVIEYLISNPKVFQETNWETELDWIINGHSLQRG